MESLAPSSNPREASVLVVDDNYAVLEFVREALTRAGFQVLGVTNGEDANRLLRERRFDVLLADLRMSPISGWDVIREAKEHAGTEIIVMTGYASLESSLEALHQGVFDLLQKPIEIDRLTRVVTNAAQAGMLARKNRDLVQELASHNAQLEAELERLRSELDEFVDRDPVTGLRNHRALESRLEEEVSRSVRYNHPLTLALLEMDHFDELSEYYGQLRAHEAAQQVASLLKKTLRKSDVVCRTGTNQFGLLLTVTPRHKAEPTLDRIREAIADSGIPIGGGRFLTCSIGIAGTPEDSEKADRLRAAAESALQLARAKGFNSVVLASSTPFQ